MKKLNIEETKLMANALSMTEQEAHEVANVFADIFTNEQNGKSGWKIHSLLESVNDYIREWEDHWHREANWQEYYLYEKENCYYDYDGPEEIFKTLDTFKKYIQIYDYAYELKCNGMIIIVC